MRRCSWQNSFCCQFTFKFEFKLKKHWFKFNIFRDLQVPVQPAHPSKCSAPREDEREVKQIVEEGLQGLHKWSKITNFTDKKGKNMKKKMTQNWRRKKPIKQKNGKTKIKTWEMKTYKIRNKKNDNEMRLARRRMKNNNKVCICVRNSLRVFSPYLSLTDVTTVLISGNLTNVKGYVLTADPEKYKYFPFWEENHVITWENLFWGR